MGVIILRADKPLILQRKPAQSEDVEGRRGAVE